MTSKIWCGGYFGRFWKLLRWPRFFNGLYHGEGTFEWPDKVEEWQNMVTGSSGSC
jgi:hypothetical protein